MGNNQKKKFVSMNNRHKRLGKSPFSWCIFILLLICSLYCLYKLFWGLMTSLKDVNQFMDNKLGLPNGAPWNWAWENYTYALKNFYVPVTNASGTQRVWIEQLFMNSVLFAGVGALLKVLVPTWMGYLTAKFKYKFSEWIYTGVLIIMMIPIVGNSASTLKLMHNLGIYDTYFSFWLMKISFTDMSYLLLFAAFKGVPDGYREAAVIDGAGEFTIFFRINLPMVMPVVLTFLLTNFISFWNDYMTPLIYSPSKPTLSYGVYVLTNTNLQGFSRTPMRMATSYLAGVPMIALFIVFRKQIMKKMSLGGLKE